MNILLEIKTKLANLPPNEQKVARFILENPRETVSMSVQEIAKKAGASPASVTRFTKSMEIDGIAQLKILLTISLSQQTPQEDLRELEANESVASIKVKLKARINHMTQLVNRQLSDKVLEQISDLIMEAEIIIVFGIGASFLVAQDIVQKFTRLGKFIVCYDNLHSATSFLASNTGRMVCIAVSERGRSKEVLVYSKLVKNQKIPLVSLTGNKQSTLAKASDYLLLSATGENFEFRQAATVSLIAQIYAVDLLFYTYVSRNFDASQQAIRQSALLINQVEERQ